MKEENEPWLWRKSSSSTGHFKYSIIIKIISIIINNWYIIINIKNRSTKVWGMRVIKNDRLQDAELYYLSRENRIIKWR